jgi:hypothetical protein
MYASFIYAMACIIYVMISLLFSLQREETRIVRLMRETIQRYIEPTMRRARPVLAKRKQALNTNRRKK